MSRTQRQSSSSDLISSPVDEQLAAVLDAIQPLADQDDGWGMGPKGAAAAPLVAALAIAVSPAQRSTATPTSHRQPLPLIAAAKSKARRVRSPPCHMPPALCPLLGEVGPFMLSWRFVLVQTGFDGSFLEPLQIAKCTGRAAPDHTHGEPSISHHGISCWTSLQYAVLARFLRWRGCG